MGTSIMVLKKAGKPPIKFHKGGLHETTHTPAGEKIPKSKIDAALNGRYGKKGEAQARFMKNVLTGRK